MATEIQTLVTQRNVPCISTVREHSDACRFDFVKNTVRRPLDCCILIMCGLLPAAVSGWNVATDGCVWHTICRVAKMTAEHHGPVLADGPTVCQEGSIFLFRPPIRYHNQCTSESPFAFSLKVSPPKRWQRVRTAWDPPRHKSTGHLILKVKVTAESCLCVIKHHAMIALGERRVSATHY